MESEKTLNQTPVKRKTYLPPRVEVVELLPKETVLGTCKDSTVFTDGKFTNVCLSGGFQCID